MKTYQESEKHYSADIKARLTRDADNRKIAGVCAGLGNYFGIDISLMRLAWFFLAFFGIFSAGISTFMVVLAYFILWFIIPKSTTTHHF